LANFVGFTGFDGIIGLGLVGFIGLGIYVYYYFFNKAFLSFLRDLSTDLTRFAGTTTSPLCNVYTPVFLIEPPVFIGGAIVD
jgi:ABC-type branched-subunit amino acid transport system permease subunit